MGSVLLVQHTRACDVEGSRPGPGGSASLKTPGWRAGKEAMKREHEEALGSKRIARDLRIEASPPGDREETKMHACTVETGARSQTNNTAQSTGPHQGILPLS